VTAVTVPALGASPRTVLVTRQCSQARCQTKFLRFKLEGELTDDERAVWRRK
jgi:hypothetical protein